MLKAYRKVKNPSWYLIFKPLKRKMFDGNSFRRKKVLRNFIKYTKIPAINPGIIRTKRKIKYITNIVKAILMKVKIELSIDNSRNLPISEFTSCFQRPLGIAKNNSL